MFANKNIIGIDYCTACQWCKHALCCFFK